MDPVEQLDEAAVFKILERLGPKALAKCCVVAKQWKGMAEDEKLWKAHCQVPFLRLDDNCMRASQYPARAVSAQDQPF